MESLAAWEDDDDGGLSHTSLQRDWDLEDALAHAILGDLASSDAARGDVEEEQLVERLHSIMFPVPREKKSTPTPTSSSTQRASQPPKAAARRVASATRSKSSEAFRWSESPRALSKKSISPVRIDQMLARFKLHEMKRQRSISSLQHSESTASIPLGSSSSHSSESYQTPLLSPRSRELTRNLPSFQVRQAAAVRQHEHQLAQRQADHNRRQEDVLQSVKASVRTPCICGAGAKGGHTPSCERLLESCAKLIGTSDPRHQKPPVRRSIEDIMRFDAEKKRKQEALRAIQRQREQQQAPFSPQINRTSIKIYQQLIAAGRKPELIRPRMPALPKTSVVVLQKRSQPRLHQRASVASRASTSSQRTRTKSLHQDSRRLPEAASFSESHWATRAASPARPDSSRSEVEPPFAAPWTVVEFDVKTNGFILQNFELPVCR